MKHNCATARLPFPDMGQLFTLRNASGMRATISERGAALISWWAPDRYGRMTDVVLGCSDARAYADNGLAFGAFATEHSVSLRLLPRHGESGAGAPQMIVHYRLDDDGSLAIEVEAQTRFPTPLNMTAHPYFNLTGGIADVGDHMLQILADDFVAVAADGRSSRIVRVGGTALDFRQPAAIGSRLTWPDLQVSAAAGFDHHFRVARGPGGELAEVARVFEPRSGRQLQVSTTGTGLQFQSSSALDGFSLEARATDGVLLPGKVLRQATVYRLSVR